MVVRYRAVVDRPVYYRAKLTIRQEGLGRSTPSVAYFPVDDGCRKHKGSSQPHSFAPGRTSLAADSKRFQFPVEGRSLHADELRRAGNIATEAGDLSQQIFPLEDLTCLAQGEAHELLTP